MCTFVIYFCRASKIYSEKLRKKILKPVGNVCTQALTLSHTFCRNTYITINTTDEFRNVWVTDVGVAGLACSLHGKQTWIGNC